MNELERKAVNSLLDKYVRMLCARERIGMFPIAGELYPRMLYEVEREIQEIRLILNTFLLDDHRD